MKTHILFTEGLQTSELEFAVRPITKDWHLTCNNFKGTYDECITEGEKQKIKAEKFQETRYVEPHYANAEYGSIFDY